MQSYAVAVFVIERQLSKMTSQLMVTVIEGWQNISIAALHAVYLPGLIYFKLISLSGFANSPKHVCLGE